MPGLEGGGGEAEEASCVVRSCLDRRKDDRGERRGADFLQKCFFVCTRALVDRSCERVCEGRFGNTVVHEPPFFILQGFPLLHSLLCAVRRYACAWKATCTVVVFSWHTVYCVCDVVCRCAWKATYSRIEVGVILRPEWIGLWDCATSSPTLRGTLNSR